MTQPGSVVRSQPEELYALARETRSRARETVRRAWASELAFRAAAQRYQQARAQAEGLHRALHSTRQDRLRYSAYARLQAQLDSMPVVEQAKGIIMAQYGLDADQAFDALRKASPPRNIKVRDLAATLVGATAQALPGPVAARQGQAPSYPQLTTALTTWIRPSPYADVVPARQRC
jgi:hypothetical protein